MKNLFSKTLSNKKLTVMLASFIVFAASFGFIFYEASKKTVALTLDGQKKVVTTHSSTIQDLFKELNINIRSEDYVSPSVNTEIKDQLKVEWKPAKKVQILEDEKKKTVWTTAKTVEELLEENQILLTDHDEIQPKKETKIKSELNIMIHRAFPLILENGINKQEVWSTSTTVADFLSHQGISLSELDRVEPSLENQVQKDAVVKVIRVEKVTDVVEEPIRFAVVTKKDDQLASGTEKILTEGKEGILSKEFEVLLENGVEVARTLINETTKVEKQDQVVSVGTQPIAQPVVSRGQEPAGKELYVSSTAYTASCNGCSGTTATGINLKSNPNAKVIAVDPKVIPLGTKVYVEGYGYAIAADTGGAIDGHKIDVFFASKADAYRWGRKKVKIKILS
ncbi:G5 and 3D domain-containing protein [Bacillus sp. 03113]|uniref:G5 and 3D domain-containing protein n=1 Tax=Bacillus sp. 03113 TaxID=2578211 RepID=UPI001141F924|nr:G5 and 3D domain-containing protein [Bacillus sp. 03113]